MATFVLTDLAHDVWVESFNLDNDALFVPPNAQCSVKKRRLRGGRRDGVDLIEVNNGGLAFSVVPTRGMGIWSASYKGHRLAWISPVNDGPVNPAFVNLAAKGGLGWLDGFDELLARCGLENNGAPFEIKTKKADGSESYTTFGLHGKIANTPASYVAIHLGDEPPHEITIEGHVEETHLFGPQIRMVTRIRTTPRSNHLVVRDEFINLKDQPVDMQILYHWNFGPPILEEGARFLAPWKTVTPRDPRAVEGLETHDVYGPPEPGFAEQCYFYELLGQGDSGATLAMLRSRGGDKAVVLRFQTSQLPCFTLWKNTAGLRDGYVTGLEPATNYPNALPFEKARSRVVTLPPGGRHVAEITLAALNTPQDVAAVEAEIAQLQAQSQPVIHPGPKEPFAAEG
ncbi:MAG: aldose 1-epimerase family protein [Isosphaeraceae bacterium]